jgi:hypothetical protein
VILPLCVLKKLLGVLNGAEPPNESKSLMFVEVLRVASVAQNY